MVRGTRNVQRNVGFPQTGCPLALQRPFAPLLDAGLLTQASGVLWLSCAVSTASGASVRKCRKSVHLRYEIADICASAMSCLASERTAEGQSDSCNTAESAPGIRPSRARDAGCHAVCCTPPAPMASPTPAALSTRALNEGNVMLRGLLQTTSIVPLPSAVKRNGSRAAQIAAPPSHTPRGAREGTEHWQLRRAG